MLQPSARFVNVGRGALVDEEALAEALAKRWIAGAALDVFATEPLGPEQPLVAAAGADAVAARRAGTPWAGGTSWVRSSWSCTSAGRRLPLFNVVDKQRGYVPGTERAGGRRSSPN
ncbi:Glyoxylate/hydroxypyruvate reductase B [Streptomyces glaucescens]